VPAALERRKEASKTPEGCGKCVSLTFRVLNGAEPATQRRPHHSNLRFIENVLLNSGLLTADDSPGRPGAPIDLREGVEDALDHSKLAGWGFCEILPTLIENHVYGNLHCTGHAVSQRRTR